MDAGQQPAGQSAGSKKGPQEGGPGLAGAAVLAGQGHSARVLIAHEAADAQCEGRLVHRFPLHRHGRFHGGALVDNHPQLLARAQASAVPDEACTAPVMITRRQLLVSLATGTAPKPFRKGARFAILPASLWCVAHRCCRCNNAVQGRGAEWLHWGRTVTSRLSPGCSVTNPHLGRKGDLPSFTQAHPCAAVSGSGCFPWV